MIFHRIYWSIYCGWRWKLALAVADWMICAASRWECRMQRAKQKLVWRQ